ncbi:hypothetical protein ABZ714_28645 [Streptomyces sp. NPDC006798]|uniref:hypothetical protein n=1 Tax=Streptomyces sp. NPDC006798 TaxID=3155462 RepID=UPI0033F1FA74
MFKRRIEKREWQELDAGVRARSDYFRDLADPLETPEPATPDVAATEPDTVVDDFLPLDFVAPSQRETAGLMMAWPGLLVVDGEILACPECGTYRDWIALSAQGRVWLRCRAGHETQPGLDTAWFNRNSGPMTHEHASYQDGIRFLGH